MSDTQRMNNLFSAPKPNQDMRMLLDRLLAPETAHPYVRDFMESIREGKQGEAHLALSLIKFQLKVNEAEIQDNLAILAYCNAAHATEPFLAFDYLINSHIIPDGVATIVCEHLILCDFSHDRTKTMKILEWFFDNGAIIPPESKPAWTTLESKYPPLFSLNLSKFESQKLDTYIKSQSLEVREVNRL
jgi:hypothetical protein